MSSLTVDGRVPFELKNKVAIVTGGAQGIGLAIVKTFLEKKIRAVTIIDINIKVGNEVVDQLRKEFPGSQLHFVKADVRSYQEFEGAFKQTVEKFQNIDVLVNNAGIMNDSKWVDEIGINVTGVVNGLVLAVEHYIPKYKTGAEGIVVNVASVAGLQAMPMIPIYSGTKHAVVGFTRSFGCKCIYDRTKTKVVAVCPGFTDTTLVQKNLFCLSEFHQQMLSDLIKNLNKLDATVQKVEHVAKALLKVLEKGDNGSVWVAEDDSYTYEYFFPDKNGMKKRHSFAIA